MQQLTNAHVHKSILYSRSNSISTGVHVHVECRGFESHQRQLILGKVTALGVLCCFALFVCLTLLASFFLPSHLSFKNMYTISLIKTCTCTFKNGGRPFCLPCTCTCKAGETVE